MAPEDIEILETYIICNNKRDVDEEYYTLMIELMDTKDDLSNLAQLLSNGIMQSYK